MYFDHFGMREPPFSITPDPEFYFDYPIYRDAFDTLLVALHAGEGFIKITGEVGTGKTLLCRRLLDRLGDSEDFVTAYLPNPLLNALGVLHAVAEELALEVPAGADGYHLIKLITGRLLDISAGGRRVALLIDDAQVLTETSLEAIRLLSNIETEKRKLLQVVLFGQPELDERLRRTALRQLRQRITFSQKLLPLDTEGVAGYVNHRLITAGYNGRPLFGRRAFRVLHRASGGLPRLVNILCHKSLMLCYGAGADRVETRMVRAAARDTEDSRVRAGGIVLPGWAAPALGIAGGGVLLGLAAWYWFFGDSL
jgi:MSHA biogenesis protein MshM